VFVKYRFTYPPHESDVSITLDFFLVGSASMKPEFSVSISDTKTAGMDLLGQQMISVPAGVPTGYYRVVPTVNSKNSCDEYQDTELGELTFMLVAPGTKPCAVWPGDVNNDGLVNFGDRKSLTAYIHEADLDPLWLNGPARYRSDGESNPLSYLVWEAQAAVPWFTPDGCYMDSDGNGMINNYDYIAIKMNWMKAHDEKTGKSVNAVSPGIYRVSQNFPNPFNPSTTLEFSVPEPSQVKILVTDVLGREVATLIDAAVEKGSRTITFNASGLGSGVYLAVVSMQGLESGQTYYHTVRMTLAK
jgi:hypothetical protein